MTKPFIDYWDEVDDHMMALFGIDTMAGDNPTADMLADAQEANWTAKEFALWFGENYGLKTLPGAA